MGSNEQKAASHCAIAVSGADIKPSTCVKLLGVLIDDDLSLKSQVNKTVSTGFYQL